jgi:hypothetical protein
MLEFGRVIMVQQILANATKEGAWTAILDAPTTAAHGDPMTVAVPYGSMKWLPSPQIVKSTSHIKASAVMRCATVG